MYDKGHTLVLHDLALWMFDNQQDIQGDKQHVSQNRDINHNVDSMHDATMSWTSVLQVAYLSIGSYCLLDLT